MYEPTVATESQDGEEFAWRFPLRRLPVSAPAAVAFHGRNAAGAVTERSVRPSSAVRWDVETFPHCVVVQAADVAAEQRNHIRNRELDVTDPVALPRVKGTRGVITGWSAQSRRNLIRACSSVDLSGDVCMVTLTYPADWYRTREGGWRTPDVVKAEVDALRKRYERRYGPLQGVWKLETQRRGAPHYHIALRLPEGVPAVKVHRTLRAAWSSIVYGPVPADPVKAAEHRERVRQHRRFGVHMDATYARGIRGKHSTVAAYFAKHGVWSTKDYQNTAGGHVIRAALAFTTGMTPLHAPVGGPLDPFTGEIARPDVLAPWHDFADAWDRPGRWWGLWRLPRQTEALTIDVEPDVIHVARLLLRKVVRRRSQRLAIDSDLREVIVTRTMRSLHGDSDRGFWITSADAPALTGWVMSTAEGLAHLRGVDLAFALTLVPLPDMERPRLTQPRSSRGRNAAGAVTEVFLDRGLVPTG